MAKLWRFVYNKGHQKSRETTGEILTLHYGFYSTIQNFSACYNTSRGIEPPGGGGDFTYERGGNARWKFWIKPLKETDLARLARW